MSEPKRGEVWLVNFDPTIGAEIKKTRPVVVISIDPIRALPIRLVVPLTKMQPHFAAQSWKVFVQADKTNNLDFDSVADVMQMRAVDTQRFVKQVGKISHTQLSDIATAIALVVDYSPDN